MSFPIVEVGGRKGPVLDRAVDRAKGEKGRLPGGSAIRVFSPPQAETRCWWRRGTAEGRRGAGAAVGRTPGRHQGRAANRGDRDALPRPLFSPRNPSDLASPPPTTTHAPTADDARRRRRGTFHPARADEPRTPSRVRREGAPRREEPGPRRRRPRPQELGPSRLSLPSPSSRAAAPPFLLRSPSRAPLPPTARRVTTQGPRGEGAGAGAAEGEGGRRRVCAWGDGGPRRALRGDPQPRTPRSPEAPPGAIDRQATLRQA